MHDAQTLWARLLLSSLAEAGLRQVVVSPGSRSTPLVWAALSTPGLACRRLIDERSAGFFALGQARVSGLPSLLICTSGSALCHYYPAVVEAARSGVPLLVLSADRPFELSDCGAPQTIDQTRAFGAHARFRELGTPDAHRDALLGLRRAAYQSFEEASSGAVVHLNFRARKPLEPAVGVSLPELGPMPALDPEPAARRCGPSADALGHLVESLRASRLPLVACGALAPFEAVAAPALARFAEQSGALLHLEAASQLRFRASDGPLAASACDASDWVLGSRALGPHLNPDFVLQIGAPPMSAAIQGLLHDGRARLAICASRGWPDPFHKSAQIVRSDPTRLLEALGDALEGAPRRPPRAERETWLTANAMARSVVARHLSQSFSEGAAVRELISQMPAGSVLSVGNSLTPRHLDRYCAAADRALVVLSQRGVNGIDGGVAAALGAATVAAAPVTALLGDVSFLHDVGSLWAARPERVGGAPLERPVVIAVLNNAGGRIFEQLPIADGAGVDLSYWTSPHELTLSAAASLYGVAYAGVTRLEQMAPALRAAYASPGVTLVELETSRDGARELQSAIAAELEGKFAELLEGP